MFPIRPLVFAGICLLPCVAAAQPAQQQGSIVFRAKTPNPIVGPGFYPALSVGSQVRFEFTAGRPAEGRFMGHDAYRFLIDQGHGIERMDQRDVQRILKRQGHGLDGVVIGGLAGLGVGITLAFPSDGSAPHPVSDALEIVTGAMVGGILGWAVGTASPTWEPVGPDAWGY